MVVNSGLEDLERRMRLKRVWKLVPPTEKKKKEEQLSLNEQRFWILVALLGGGCLWTACVLQILGG